MHFIGGADGAYCESGSRADVRVCGQSIAPGHAAWHMAASKAGSAVCTLWHAPGAVLSWRYAGMQVIVAGSSNTSKAQDQGTSCSVTCSDTHAAGSCAQQFPLWAHLGALSIQHTRPLKVLSAQTPPSRRACMPAHVSRTSGLDRQAVKMRRRDQGRTPTSHGLSPH